MTIKLLQCHNYSTSWMGTDTEEQFRENLKSQSTDWTWREQKVEYARNSQNYRAPEWDTIDWSNSVVMFGCSRVFGIGVNDDQTSSHYLSELINRPVINLGIPGGSCMALWVNTEKLLKYRIKPWAVIYQWPEVSRTAELLNDTKNVCSGTWILEYSHSQYGKEWALHPTHGLEYAKYAIMSVKRAWKCTQLHYTWDKRASKFLNVSETPKVLDHARDCLHDGPITLKSHAKQWCNDIIKLNKKSLKKPTKRFIKGKNK